MWKLIRIPRATTKKITTKKYRKEATKELKWYARKHLLKIKEGRKGEKEGKNKWHT